MLARRIIMPRGNRYYIPGLIWHTPVKQKPKRVSRGRFPIGATKRNFCSNSPGIANDSCVGCMRRKSGMCWRYSILPLHRIIFIFLYRIRGIAILCPRPYNWSPVAQPRRTIYGRNEKVLSGRTGTMQQLFRMTRIWSAALRKGGHAREAKWTQRIAVGSKVFIEDVKDPLGYKAMGRKIVKAGHIYQLKERQASYNCNFGSKMSPLRVQTAWTGMFILLIQCNGSVRPTICHDLEVNHWKATSIWISWHFQHWIRSAFSGWNSQLWVGLKAVYRTLRTFFYGGCD